ncbi:MAG: cation transporter [Clostridia bacterium]|nr:cation transporter [Clostridia bacterium]
MELLFRLFIKNHNNTNDEAVRRKYGILGSTTGIVLNLLLFVLKTLAGVLTRSIGIIADAVNNLSDAGSSIITLIGFRLSGKPADHDHPFGHGRFEYISALFVSFIILLMAFELCKSSVSKILTPEAVSFSTVSAVILTVSILIKGWMYLFNKKIGKTISSQSMAAGAKDSLSDSVATLAVLISLVVSQVFRINIDGYMGLAVSVFIFYTGISTLRDSVSPLLGGTPDKELVQNIESTILAHKEIVGIHDLIIHNYGPTRFMLSVHAEVPASSDILKIHDTIDIIEREIAKKFRCDAVIHMDPIETDNEVIAEARETVKSIINDISPALSMHDFRMVSGDTHTNLIFDVVVPFDFEMSSRELTGEIQKRVFNHNSTYYVVITIDKNYV